jgi:hypothetical protein
MVGALADWFAVTALFRHPLDLPDATQHLNRLPDRHRGAHVGEPPSHALQCLRKGCHASIQPGTTDIEIPDQQAYSNGG